MSTFYNDIMLFRCIIPNLNYYGTRRAVPWCRQCTNGARCRVQGKGILSQTIRMRSKCLAMTSHWNIDYKTRLLAAFNRNLFIILCTYFIAYRYVDRIILLCYILLLTNITNNYSLCICIGIIGIPEMPLTEIV